MSSKPKVVIVTGGAGFIGSHFVRYLINYTKNKVINLDKLTYSGSKNNIKDIYVNKRHHFIKGNICSKNKIKFVLKKFKPDYIVNFAAETHVDNSIKNSDPFIKTNIIGTYNLLNLSKIYWDRLEIKKKKQFKFLQVSTDEVFGDLKQTDQSFNENTRYDPSSPYSASKASADHIVRAFYRTYKFPINITNCSNNYGPNQHKEKLIPLVINNIFQYKKLPIYGKGLQIRDWLYVEDHVEAIWKIILKGKIGETYLIGGNNEKKNIFIVNLICDLLDQVYPSKKNNITTYKSLIKFVKDRPGHDFRYAINARKIFKEIKWKPRHSFEEGIKKTVNWYLKEFLKK